MGTLRNIGDIIPVGHNSFTRLDLLDETPLYSRPKKHLPNMPPKNTLADAWDDPATRGPAVDRLKNSRVSEVIITNTLPTLKSALLL